MSKTAFILFGHGARDPRWGDSMRRVAAALNACLPGRRVELAFLEFIDPGLVDCAEGLIAEGYDHLLIVPLFTVILLPIFTPPRVELVAAGSVWVPEEAGVI